MTRILTLLEAWDDFYSFLHRQKAAGEIQRIPNRVQQAEYARRGRGPYALSERRARWAFEEFRPGHYKAVQTVTFEVEG